MLNEIRERWAKATPGNWSWVIKGNSVQSHAVVCHNDEVSLMPQNICSGISHKTGNAVAIASAPSDIAYLLQEVERLQAENEGMKCCGNCKYYTDSVSTGNCICVKNCCNTVTYGFDKCDMWEMMSK